MKALVEAFEVLSAMMRRAGRESSADGLDRMAAGMDHLEERLDAIDSRLAALEREAGRSQGRVEALESEVGGAAPGPGRTGPGLVTHRNIEPVEINAGKADGVVPLAPGETIWDRLRPEMEAAGLPSPGPVVSPSPGVFGDPSNPATMEQAKEYARRLMGVPSAEGG